MKREPIDTLAEDIVEEYSKGHQRKFSSCCGGTKVEVTIRSSITTDNKNYGSWVWWGTYKTLSEAKTEHNKSVGLITADQVLEQALEHYHAEDDDWGHGQCNIDQYPKYRDPNKYFYAKKVTCVDWECLCEGDKCTCNAPSRRTIECEKRYVFVYPK